MGCKDCTKRRVGYHSNCEDYKAYRSNLDKQNALNRQQKQYYRDWKEFKDAGYRKNGVKFGAV